MNILSKTAETVDHLPRTGWEPVIEETPASSHSQPLCVMWHSFPTILNQTKRITQETSKLCITLIGLQTKKLIQWFKISTSVSNTGKISVILEMCASSALTWVNKITSSLTSITTFMIHINSRCWQVHHAHRGIATTMHQPRVAAPPAQAVTRRKRGNKEKQWKNNWKKPQRKVVKRSTSNL